MAPPRFPDTSSRPSILERLATEWRCLTIRAGELNTARSWELPGGRVQTLDEVLERCGYVSAAAMAHTAGTDQGSRSGRDDAGDRAAHDAYLLRLLTLARHDQLAARIVLQRIVPLLVAFARQHSPTVWARQALVDELIGNAWPSIRSYPIERRPTRVVPNLVSDIGFATIVRPARRRSASEMPTGHANLRDSECLIEPEPLDELVELLNQARHAGMTQGDIDLICQIVTMYRPTEVARVLQVSSRTVRNHRDAIVHRLREVAAVAA
jgi:hypothetical protein